MPATLLLLIAPAAAELPAAAADPTTGLLLRVVIFLGLLGVLWLAARRLSRSLSRSTGAGRGLLELVESRRVDSKATIHLVRVAGRSFLLGRTEGGLSALSSGRLDEAEIEAALAACRTGTGAKKG